MSIITEYYTQAELALAAYSTLTTGMLKDDYINALKDNGKGMSENQASEFAANWSVVDQFSGISGVSATVFKEKETGKTFLAIRGTNNLGDITADYIIEAGFPSSLNPQFIQLQNQVSQWLAAGKLSSGFTIAGHSIGGYLAAAIGTAFSAESAAVYTFNAPGLGSGYGNIFDAFRAAFGLSDTALIDGIINVRGTAGISLISGTGAQLSPPVLVETESSLSPFANHSIVGLTDALAVYCLFAEMSPNLTIEDISGIIRADSYQADMALETTVQKLADIFISNAPRIASGDREELYAAIQTLPTLKHDHPNLQINSLAGLSESAIASLAEAQGESGLATRYALVSLNPFTVTGESGLYDRFNANGELDICTNTNQDGDLSSQYIEDRAKFLYYLAHSDATVSNFDPDIDFVDNRLGVSLEVDNGMIGLDADSQYLFGNLEGEHLEGGSAIDHLYGMDGDDSLIGNDGEDYLEGGKGQDTLNGGS
ncbi:MAG: hypothetical protein Q8R88_17595, partial [Desulfoprunum sp.]|nr:hypothetical protein [Desulfoprunum sp.]